MRIAFVSTIFAYGWGGADTLWTAAASTALKRGDQVLISVSATVAQHEKVQELRRRGAIIANRTPPPDHYPLGLRLMLRLRLRAPHDTALIRTLTEFQPDLIIFSLGGTYDLLPFRELGRWLLAASTPFRLIANWQTEHPDLGPEDFTFIRSIFTAAERVSFVSTRNLAITRRHLLSALPNARVVQNPLRWQPADVSPWPTASNFRLATVSRLDPGKGIHLLLHALAGILPALPDWHLDIFGRGPLENYLRETVVFLGLGARVTFRGHVAQLRDIWAGNHLLVSPAIDEGVPLTIPETMLCGRPVLATCVGGAEDWLSHGETGFLCPAPTVPLIVSALLEAARQRDRWEQMGKAASAAARDHYRSEDHLQLIA